MAQADMRTGLGCKIATQARSAPLGFGDARFETEIPRDAVADFVLGAPTGSVIAVAGISSEDLRSLVDQRDSDPNGTRALFAEIQSSLIAETIVDVILDLFADTALRLWPIWFTNVSFSQFRNDTAGKLALKRFARRLAKDIPEISPAWVEAAAKLAYENRPPRVMGVARAIELTQLAHVISRPGLVLVTNIRSENKSASIVHALEWIAQHTHCAVVALFAQLPANEPPLDRILYRAHRVADSPVEEVHSAEPKDTLGQLGRAWIAPWRGRPHPLSDIEQRLSKAIDVDKELCTLFRFNWIVGTLRGSRPRVDLVWTDGRLVVEIDGYESHGNRRAFVDDRHRDYELMLSGYIVLRLTNDEVDQDCEKALEKIRDLVRLRRNQIVGEV